MSRTYSLRWVENLGAGRFTTTDADIVTDADGWPLMVGRSVHTFQFNSLLLDRAHADRLGIAAAVEAGEYPGVEVFDPVQHEGQRPMTTTDTTTGTDTTTDAAGTTAVEPQPAVTDEITTVDTPPTETSEASPEGGAEVDEDQDDDADDGHGAGPGREAAKYRRRLREAETERDRLSEQVGALQRAEVERLATADDLRPAALWASGVELAGLLTDDGTVDAEKVSAAIGAAR